MDLVNDLSSDLAIAVFVDGTLSNKLGTMDAKSFVALVEEELERISNQVERPQSERPAGSDAADLSH